MRLTILNRLLKVLWYFFVSLHGRRFIKHRIKSLPPSKHCLFPQVAGKVKTNVYDIEYYVCYELDAQSLLFFNEFVFSFQVSNELILRRKRAPATEVCVFLTVFSLPVICFNCHDLFCVTESKRLISLWTRRERSYVSLKESEHNTLIQPVPQA